MYNLLRKINERRAYNIMSDFREFIRSAGNVVPSKVQLDRLNNNFYAFVHFCPNTFTGLEWGLGNEDPACFNPPTIDCDGWVEAIKSAGMTGAVITAKHHDGFCLWDTKYTTHSVMYSPLKRDVVKEFSDACRRGGIKFGFYLSPWDRNSKYYGTDEYNEYYINQLTELLTDYGEVFHVWFDGSCGEGPNGKKQEYEWEKYFELIRKYQPNATIFKDDGPDIRWCGNESAAPRQSEWAVVPMELCGYAEVQTGPSPIAGDLKATMTNPDPDIGTLSNIINSKGLVFAPSEYDVSIRKGWFWHAEEEPHSLERLFQIYLDTVGSNGCLNLNVPPDNMGKIDERDVKRLKEFGELLKTEFGCNLAEGCETVLVEKLSETQAVYEVDLGQARDIKYIELREDIAKGQRVENYRINFYDPTGDHLEPEWMVCHGTTIGNCKIHPLHRDMWEGIVSRRIRLTITSSRDVPEILPIKVY